MLLAGVTLGYFIGQQFEDEAKSNFGKFHEDAKNTLNNLQNLYKTDATILSSNANLIASLNLISEYASENDYKNVIFDSEKWSLAKRLTTFAHAAHIDHAYILDKNGQLVCFTDNEGNQGNRLDNEEGILSFKNSKPVFITKSIDGKISKSTPTDDIWLTLSTPRKISATYATHYTKSSGSEVFLESVAPIFRTLPDGHKIFLGNLYLGKELDENYFSQIASDRDIKIQLLYADDIHSQPGISPIPVERLVNVPSLIHDDHHDESTAINTSSAYITTHSLSLQNGHLLYIFSSINREIVQKKIHDAQWLMFSIFLLSSLFILIIGIFFSRRNITRPMDKLIHNAKQLEAGQYSLENTETGMREFDMLNTALKNAATTIHTREGQLRDANIEMESRVQQRTSDLRKINLELADEISTRETVEEQLRESKDMLKMVMDNIPTFIFWKDTNSRYLGCNTNFLQATGYKNESDIIGKTDYDMPWTKEEADFYISVDKRVMTADIPEYHIQETQTTADGKTLFAETNKIPLHDKNHNVIGILGTYEDITERKKSELQILQAKEIAESANSAKSDFLSRMSHELRTPLNAILGFAQLLEYDLTHPLDKEQIQSVSEILTAGNHLLELINDILDLSKIEAGTLALSIRPTQLYDTITESISFIKNFAEQNNIRLHVHADNVDNLNVNVDPIRLKQILLNLLTNAIKYNRPGGEVTLSIERPDDYSVKIIITDTGIGINEEYQLRVFTPFDRLGADARAMDGTGIGLVIAKQLIEIMHGEIGFTSKPGVGTTFWFTLPVVLTNTILTDIHSESNPNIIAAELLEDNSKIILCIEDNNANLRLVENIIHTKTSYKIITAKSAEEGFELLAHITPDLILMDITLPGMNGIEATSKIKHNDDYQDIPVIAISANAMIDDIQNGLNSGFSDYLTKPINISLLLETLQKYLH